MDGKKFHENMTELSGLRGGRPEGRGRQGRSEGDGGGQRSEETREGRGQREMGRSEEDGGGQRGGKCSHREQV